MFGKLQGRFVVVGSSILAAYGCESSGYYGSEHLGQLDPNNYRSVGMLMLKDKLVYSWQTLHKRAPAAKAAASPAGVSSRSSCACARRRSA